MQSHSMGIEEVVMDKGYHSGAVLVDLAEREIRSYVPEPERGKRRWSGKAKEQRRVYGNRRRVRAERSKRLQKLRLMPLRSQYVSGRKAFNITISSVSEYSLSNSGCRFPSSPNITCLPMCNTGLSTPWQPRRIASSSSMSAIRSFMAVGFLSKHPVTTQSSLSWQVRWGFHEMTDAFSLCNDHLGGRPTQMRIV
jgi:hypothetical protein